MWFERARARVAPASSADSEVPKPSARLRAAPPLDSTARVCRVVPRGARRCAARANPHCEKRARAFLAVTLGGTRDASTGLSAVWALGSCRDRSLAAFCRISPGFAANFRQIFSTTNVLRGWVTTFHNV